MSFFAEAAADAAEILAEIGRPVTFRDVPALAIIGGQEMSLDLGTGGFSESGQLACKLLAASFQRTPPQDGERITHAGKTYRITSIMRREPSPWYELKCAPLTQ